VDSASYNPTTGLFTYANVVPSRANQCINGDCSLPGEIALLNSGCQSSVSVFTVDYDAPLLSCHPPTDVRALLVPLVQYANSSQFVGGLGGTNLATSSGGAGTVAAAAPAPMASLLPSSRALRTEVPWLAALFGGAFIAILAL